MNDKTNEKSVEAAKKRLAETREAQEKAAQKTVTGQDVDQSDWKPTPTQEENDLAKLGAHITDHEPDGSPPQDQTMLGQQGKQSEPRAGSGGGYTTRDAKPAATRPATTQSHSS